MPTPAELALQKKYAELRAKKEKVGLSARYADGTVSKALS